MSEEDSLTEYPTYIKHWEEEKPWGCQIRILTENGLHIFNCKRKDVPKETWIEGYSKHKKDYDKWKEERCPHN